MPIAQLLRPAQTLGCRRLTDASRLARKSKVSRKEVFEQFVAFDQNNDGFITLSELRRALDNDCKLSTEDVQALIKEADIDGDGKINFAEFTQVMASNPQVMKGEMPSEKRVPYDRSFG